jgi:hypothetical protein
MGDMDDRQILPAELKGEIDAVQYAGNTYLLASRAQHREFGGGIFIRSNKTFGISVRKGNEESVKQNVIEQDVPVGGRLLATWHTHVRDKGEKRSERTDYQMKNFSYEDRLHAKWRAILESTAQRDQSGASSYAPASWRYYLISNVFIYTLIATFKPRSGQNRLRRKNAANEKDIEKIVAEEEFDMAEAKPMLRQHAH